MSAKPSLGVIFHPTFPPEILAAYASRAEAAGFDELWLWEDCFYAGAFASAAVALASTQTLQVGIGILPAVVRNPLFAAMEITALARLYPGRFIAGFGQGYEPWMKQIGVYPKSPLKALGETVEAVRALLNGENVTFHGQHVHLDHVQMKLIPETVPPLLIGGIREKSLRLAGLVGDGAVFTSMSSPAYLCWASQHVASGAAEAGRSTTKRVVFVLCQVSPDGVAARKAARRFLANQFAAGDAHLIPMGIAEEAAEMVRQLGIDGTAERMPDAWVDALAAAGTPQQAAATLQQMAEAGADTLVLEPIQGDPEALHNYIRYLLPVLHAD